MHREEEGAAVRASGLPVYFSCVGGRWRVEGGGEGRGVEKWGEVSGSESWENPIFTANARPGVET